MSGAVIAVELLLVMGVSVLALVTLSDNAARERSLRERASGTVRQRRSEQLQNGLNNRLRATAWGTRLEARLRGAGMTVSVLDFVLIVAAAALVPALLLHHLFGNIGSLVLVIGIVALANRWIENRRQKRLEAFVGQLPDIARVLSNGASAGLALPSAIRLAARELEEPARTELTQVSEQIGLGRGLNQALAEMRTRLPSRELGVLVQTLVIQSRSGGALVSALTNIATTLEQRKELRREVRTATSGAVFSGYVVVGLGVGSVFVMNLLSPGALDQLARTGIGRAVLAVAAAFFVTGMLIMRRMTAIEV